MMKDEPCPTCHNPLGASLKALHEERDRLIAFVLQQKTKKEELQRREEKIKQREEKLLQNEVALAELIRKARIPEAKEFENLKYENLALKRQLGLLVEAHNAANEKLKNSIDSLQKNLDSEKSRNREWEKKSTVSQLKIRILESLAEASRQEKKRLEAQYENAKEQQLVTEKKNNLLTIKNQNLSKKITSTEKKLVLLQAEKEKLMAEYQEKVDNRSAFVINDLDLVHALSCAVTEQISPPDRIITIGHGPYDKYAFNNYLKHFSIKPCTSDSSWIVVGRQGWTEEQLDALIDNSNLDELRVFSQELFVAGILTTHDPFSLPFDILKKFAEGHPALEYLMESGFEWPEITIEKDYGKPKYLSGTYYGEEESPLVLKGYHAGVTCGLSPLERRDFLESAYKEEIDYVGDDEYMEEWGHPGRSKRLWRIAHHLAWLIRSRKSNRDMRYAVKDWQADLDWLEKQFYTNRMRFKWPNG